MSSSSQPRPPDPPSGEQPLAPPALATLVLDRDALREALVAALLDERVFKPLVEAVRSIATSATLPRFMSVKEYAAHAKISARTFSYEMANMTEGVHFSRSGRRVRIHVKEADEFIAQSDRARRAKEPSPKTDLTALARQEAARRKLKTPAQRKKTL